MYPQGTTMVVLRGMGSSNPPRIPSNSGVGRVGCHNVRGYKVNHDYVHKLLSNLDILTISEHWLHNYDLYLLQSNHNKFNVYSVSPSAEEDSVYCTPQYICGSGVVAIFWCKSLSNHIKKFPLL